MMHAVGTLTVVVLLKAAQKHQFSGVESFACPADAVVSAFAAPMHTSHDIPSQKLAPATPQRCTHLPELHAERAQQKATPMRGPRNLRAGQGEGGPKDGGHMPALPHPKRSAAQYSTAQHSTHRYAFIGVLPLQAFSPLLQLCPPSPQRDGLHGHQRANLVAPAVAAN